MSHRYESILVHCVFSTKERKALIPDSMKRRLWAYIGGIARANKFKALAVGGMPDHVHVLLSLPATLMVAKALQLVKGGSSKWMNDHSGARTFAWQDSYGAFSNRNFPGGRDGPLHQSAGRTSCEAHVRG